MTASFQVVAQASTGDFKWSPQFRTFFGDVALFGSKMSVFGSPDVIELKSDKTGDIITFAQKYIEQDHVRYVDTKGYQLQIELNLPRGKV